MVTRFSRSRSGHSERLLVTPANQVNRPLYYLHIPKTAGMSLTSVIESFFRPDEVCPFRLLPVLARQSPSALLHYQVFAGHFFYGLEHYLGRDLRYMTMLRDPIERTKSFFSHIRRAPATLAQQRMVEENWSIDDFLSDEQSNWEVTNTQTLNLGMTFDYQRLVADHDGYGKALTIKHARRLDDRAILESAKQRLVAMDFVGIAERLSASVPILCDQMGWDHQIAIPRINISPNKLLDSDVSYRTVEKMIELNQLDFELYSYATELFNERMMPFVKSLAEGRSRFQRDGVKKQFFTSISPLSEDERSNVRIKVLAGDRQVAPKGLVDLKVRVSNGSLSYLCSQYDMPVKISYHWLKASTGEMCIFEGDRHELPGGLAPNTDLELSLSIRAPEWVDRYVLRLTLVQERVAWFDTGPKPQFDDFEVAVD